MPERVDFGPEHRLAVYGSLAPGQRNHGQLAALSGDWRAGVVRGHRKSQGWGTAGGFPGFQPDPAGPRVAVQLFTSRDLPAHWARLDRFEGADYRRVTIEVDTADGPLVAQIYAVGSP